jgi:recombinational DNA repair protein (RecF pathway)
LYELLATTADALAAGPPPGPLLLLFTLRALQCEGLLPQLDVCATCRAGLLHAWEQAARPRRAAAGQSPAPQAVWLAGTGLRCQNCVAAAKARGQFNERGTWLAPEACRVLLHLRTSGRPVRMSSMAARQLGQALVILVHGALEHDLHTLRGAAQMVQEM